MLNLGQSIALLMLSARFPAAAKTPLLWDHCLYQWKDDPLKVMSVSLSPHTPLLSPAALQQCLKCQCQPGDKHGRMLISHWYPCALSLNPLLLPPPQKTHPQMPPPRNPCTLKSTKGINLLLETGGFSFLLFSHRLGWIYAARLQTVMWDLANPTTIFNLSESITAAISPQQAERSACLHFTATDFISSLQWSIFISQMDH